MAEAAGPDLAARLAALQRDYLAQLPEKLAAIEAAWMRLADGPWAGEPARALHRLVHNLAGSGQTFGVAGLSEAARAIEEQLTGAGDLDAAPSAATRARMHEALVRLRAVVQHLPAPDAAAAVSVPAAVAGAPAVDAPPRTLLLVDDDPAFCRQLADQLGHYGYPVRSFPRLAAADAAAQSEPLPAVALLGMQLPDGTGIEALEHLRSRGFSGPVVFLSASGALPVRLAAVRSGAAALFVKPFETGELVERLDGLVEPRAAEPFRVLIVEDSAALAAFYRLALEQAGMLVETVHDPMHALSVLDVLGPDLILMDVYMPGCSGLELASVIRQQGQYLGIPIVFLSTESDLGRQLAALGLGADDFLTKPIEGAHLVRAVQSRAGRARALRRLMLHDSLTGVLNHTATTARLEDEIARAERLGRPLALVVIDVDHFKSVNDRHGHLVGDRVLRSMTRLLRQRLRKTDVVGRMGGEEFAVIMPDTPLAAAHAVLESIRAHFARLEHDAAAGRFRVTISCGVAAHVAGGSPNRLIESADGAMYRAKQAGRDRVVTAS